MRTLAQKNLQKSLAPPPIMLYTMGMSTLTTIYLTWRASDWRIIAGLTIACTIAMW